VAEVFQVFALYAPRVSEHLILLKKDERGLQRYVARPHLLFNVGEQAYICAKLLQQRSNISNPAELKFPGPSLLWEGEYDLKGNGWWYRRRQGSIVARALEMVDDETKEVPPEWGMLSLQPWAEGMLAPDTT
jgi:hypothetical protein